MRRVIRGVVAHVRWIVMPVACAVALTGLTGSASDSVFLLNSGTWDNPAVVYRGWLNGTCQVNPAPHEAVVAGFPSPAFGDADVNGACPQELAVFARLHGAYFTDSPWWVGSSSSQQAIVFLPMLTVVPVSVWVVRNEPGWTTDIPARLGTAAWLAAMSFLYFRTGIFLHFAINYVPDGSPMAAYIGSGCQSTLQMRTFFDPLNNPYRSDALNIFVVDQLSDLATPSGKGFSCYGNGTPNVAYLSYDFTDATLGHEIGHMLGMQTPDVTPFGSVMVPTFGHTNLLQCPRASGVFCFGTGNLMYSDGITINGLSLGQAYRMNFDSHSWLNGAATAPARALVRACQSDYFWDDPCPALTVDAP